MITNRSPRPLALALCALGIAAGAAEAQVAPTPRGMGMGGAYVATARGHESLFLNPANLGLSNTPFWSIAIPQVNILSGITGPTFSETWDIVQASDQSAQRRAELLSRIPAEGMALDVEMRMPLATVQARNFAFGVAYGAVFDHTLGRDLVDLFVNGYESGRTDYTAGNTGGSRATFFDFAAGYGRRVGPVSIGATGHFLLGRTISRTRLFEPRIDTSADLIEVEYREVLARGGHGWSLDVGAAAEPVPGLTVSAAVANVAGSMKWGEELETRAMMFDQDDFGAPSSHWEEKFTTFLRDAEPVDPTGAPLSVYQTATGLYRDATFPATLRTGLAYRVGVTRTDLEVGYQRKLTDGRLGGSWDRTVSAGIQQRIPLMVLRAGVASDLDESSLISAGITLGAMELSAARIRTARDGAVAREAFVGSFGLHIGTRGKMR